MYKALVSFTTKDTDYRINKVYEETDFASQELIDDLLQAKYIEEYDGTLEITENGKYNVTDYEEAKVNVSSQGSTGSAVLKDVNLVDYDGTILASYSKDEFLALTKLPTFPREGLIPDGWNWTLDGAKEYLRHSGKIDIGQIYKTENGTTNIYFSLQEGRTSPWLGVCVEGTIEIDWGDGSETETLSGTSVTTRVMKKHDYAKEGAYVIKFKPQDENTYFSFRSTNTYGGMILSNNSGSGSTTNRTYQNCITKIELGDGISTLGDYAFRDMNGIKCVMIPNNVTVASTSTFDCCRGLYHVTFPSTISSITSTLFTQCRCLTSVAFGMGTSVPTNIYNQTEAKANISRMMFPAVSSCPGGQNFYSLTYCALPNSGFTTFSGSFSSSYCLSHINIPASVTTMSGSFLDCHTLVNLYFPPSVQSISNFSISNCVSLKFMDFSDHTSIPSLSNFSATSISSDMKIIVPDDLYESWKATSGWSSYASYIISKSDWDAL